ncbi:MAG TPA: Stp1/IreP family PP2C-type Ser/Thr phosphatase [Solirubrobacteraceae bacterium]|nr:Stp1/IreP family PP2C-type Ser/Thr phosphatase [Solirubrobacteraceae bacterium]
MLRVAEQYAVTDTGRQRRANEDSLLARSPLFVVADGMGGAQAGEVASRLAIESFQPGIGSDGNPEESLEALAQAANTRIHERSHSDAEHAGMGTTLTAVYVDEEQIAIAHVGDSRAYCLRAGELVRLTDDHSLVDELLRQGRLTPEEAIEHPQRSVITRALGPEDSVEVDTRSYAAREGDVYLLCSDGLTTMLPEERIRELLLGNRDLRAAGEALVAAANEAGGRDNITVVLLRLEEVAVRSHRGDEQQTATDLPVVSSVPATAAAQQASPQTPPPEPSEHAGQTGAGAPVQPAVQRVPRRPGEAQPDPARSARRARRRRLLGTLAVTLVVLGVLLAGGYLALQSVYFIGTDERGLVTVYRGVPVQLPAGIDLYTTTYVSGVSASTLGAGRRHRLLDHSLRSESDAASLVRSLELGQLE